MIRVSTTTLILVSIFTLANPASAQDSTQVNTDLSLPQDEVADTTSQQSDLEKFRKAFENVIEQKQDQDNATRKIEEKAEQDPVLELGGFVLDETRSKLARDFYALFYQNWQAPENASNFTITISEQPSIGIGTQINVQIDYEQVYSARLQPKYEYIEAVSEQAVARCQEILRQKAEVRQQLSGF